MAKINVLSEPRYQLELSADELEGLAALLGSGTGENTLDTLSLKDVYLQVRDHAVRAPNRFREIANLF
jgi:hypothetical protein